MVTGVRRWVVAGISLGELGESGRSRRERRGELEARGPGDAVSATAVLTAGHALYGLLDEVAEKLADSGVSDCERLAARIRGTLEAPGYAMFRRQVVVTGQPDPELVMRYYQRVNGRLWRRVTVLQRMVILLEGMLRRWYGNRPIPGFSVAEDVEE